MATAGQGSCVPGRALLRRSRREGPGKSMRGLMAATSGRSRQGPADLGVGQPPARDGAHGAEQARPAAATAGQSRQGPADRGAGQPRARDGAHGAELAGAWDDDLGPVEARAWGGPGRASGGHVGVEQPAASGGHVAAEQPEAAGGEKRRWLDEEENNSTPCSIRSDQWKGHC
ncbi:uncharacterized protein [Lolium perenne]|uniref:uncharacterized protein n=1 Tax=Lolium perenne TaxID=4522 RepID=UPI0021F52052|nr:uncharacterized protein LOC127299249 [Lolium perenne]